MALSGALTSLSLSAWVELPRDGSIRYFYTYKGGGSAQLRLHGRCSFGRVQSLGHLDMDLADPEWMFLRYLAQSEARARLGVCQLCGEEWERLTEFSTAGTIPAAKNTSAKCPGFSKTAPSRSQIRSQMERSKSALKRPPRTRPAW